MAQTTATWRVLRDRELFADVRRAVGGDAWRLGVLIVVGTLLEGLIVGLVFPVLEQVGAAEGEDNPIGRAMDGLLSLVGLEANIYAVAVAAVLLAAVRWLALLQQGRLTAEIRFRYVEKKRMDLFGALLHARWPYFWGERTGNLTNSLLLNCDRLGALLSNLVTIATGVTTLVVYVAVAFFASWSVSLATVVCGLLLVAATRPISRRTYESGREMTSRMSEMSSLVEEAVSGIKSIKASANEDMTIARLGTLASRYSDVGARNVRLAMWLTSSFEMLAVVALLVILVVGTEVLEVPPTTVLVVAAIFGRLFPRLATVQQVRQSLIAYLPALEAVDDVTRAARAAREEVGVVGEPLRFDGPVGVDIRGVGVDFGADPILRDVTLQVPGGGQIGIVGPSGSGKSTLANAILRLIEPATGTIEIGGLDVRTLPLGAWRRSVGYVTQETVIFNTSVRENIAWGREVSDADVERAARLAGVHDLIASLPGGYATPVGDRGQLLSGGQRQLVGLARALLGDPVLLVLDEATSALDAASEAEVLRAVVGLRGTVTTISIAHRLAAVRQADEVVVLEQGAIVERGSWDDLVAAGGRFAALWRQQTS